MKKLYILQVMIMLPMSICAATYMNKTGHPLIISKIVECSQKDWNDIDFLDEKTHGQEFWSNNKTWDEVYESDRIGDLIFDTAETSCTQTESVEILPNHSVDFENDQDQSVTIMSVALNEKREFFPTNDSFNYEITVASYPSKFSKLTINRAQ